MSNLDRSRNYPIVCASNYLGKQMPATPIDARLETLRSAPLDSWIALSEDESKIIAVGSTYGEAVAKSEQAGVNDPLIVKIPPDWSPLSI